MRHPYRADRRKGLGYVELMDRGLLAGYPGDVNIVEDSRKEVGGRPAFYGPGELRR